MLVLTSVEFEEAARVGTFNGPVTICADEAEKALVLEGHAKAAEQAKASPEAPTVTEETPSATEPSVTVEIPTAETKEARVASALEANQAAVTAEALGTIPPNTLSEDAVAAADADHAQDKAEEQV